MNQEIREQLSALIDNELDRDQARFLLKRAEHDADLVALWQRWHFVGEAMRGSTMPLRKDFASQIAARLDETFEDELPAASARHRVLRWGGGFAVAASVALVALMLSPNGTSVKPLDHDAVAVGPPPVINEAVAVSEVAPSPYREQDLRPPYRVDAQTVSSSDSSRYGSPLRFDPGQEAYWLRHQHALNDRANATHTWLAPLRPDVAEGARPH